MVGLVVDDDDVLLFPNSRQTLRTIAPGASWKGFPGGSPCGSSPRPLPLRSRGFIAWKFVMTTFAFRISSFIPKGGCPTGRSSSADRSAAVREGSRMVIPGIRSGRRPRTGVLGSFQLVQRVPGQQHRHDDGLAASRRHWYPMSDQPFDSLWYRRIASQSATARPSSSSGG